MRIRRLLAAAAVSVALVTSLTACFLLPGAPNGNGGNGGTVDDGSALVGTSWSGVDSDGDSWGMTFEEDGTIALELNGNSFDDASDVWAVDDGKLNISVALASGDAVFVGDYDGVDSPIDLDATLNDAEFTLTLERD